MYRKLNIASSNSAPLAGYRVLDFSQLIAGPAAGVMLADLGAEVIKIERPAGELGRTVGPEIGVPATFAAYNRGKRALAVDMSTPEGREVISRLVATSDVLIQNFRPGVMERLGFGYEALHAAHPNLVYASLSAYNTDGPGRDRPGTDAVLQAESGLMAVTGPEDGDPYKVGVQIIDAGTGLALGQAILAALLQRTTTGVGAHVQLSLFEVGTYLQSSAYAIASRFGSELERPGNTAGALGAPTDLFRVADGFLMVVAYFPDQWIKLCNLLGVPELCDDPRFVTNADRIAHKEELKQVLAPIFAPRGRDEWASTLAEAGIIAAPVRSHLEVVTDPVLRSLGDFAEVDNDMTEPHWLPATPYRSSTWTRVASYRPPALGEDTLELLNELGFTQDEVDVLQKRDVIYSSVKAAV
ncbi:CaiB/BaiF CoA transferase family protein [Nocardia sp. NPDC127606]|uniref:CaiB/BaiF CoA transferase family protein n=1 Tax=Nocardia sp. NPDC127606 TaxID=3345406 RepID=UPI003629AFE0